ncbi:MAG TPA: RcpC/CpaB family pilus assembly protein [Mycobacteriales bacterium]|nr:RcpC/CpaB family pilus assembly protein [Mycobacteriales bacterium]
MERGLIRLRQQLGTAFGGHPRLVAALLVGLAVAFGLSAVKPHPAAGARLWVAARDLSGGRPLGRDDLRPERLPAAALPKGALTGAAPVGRLLAAPVRAGEPLTDVRLVSADLLAALGDAGDLAVSVRVSDGAGLTSLVRAGDRVAVIATAAPGDGLAQPETVADDLQVLAVPGVGSADHSGLLIVAATQQQAAALAQAAGGSSLSVAVHAPS